MHNEQAGAIEKIGTYDVCPFTVVLSWTLMQREGVDEITWKYPRNVGGIFAFYKGKLQG